MTETSLNTMTVSQPKEADLSRRASALDEIRQMHTDLEERDRTIVALHRSLDRSMDQITLLSEERARWRHEAQLYRTKLIELATVQSNIGLLTTKAQDIMMSVTELLGAATPPNEEEEKTRLHAVADAIEKDVSDATRDN